MEIPTDIQARIDSIVSRFELRAPLGATGQTSGATTGSAIGVLGVAPSAAAFESVLAATTVPAAAQPIASKAEVKALEGRYQNGRLPDEALTSIGIGNHKLAPPAAAAFRQMVAAAEAEGITIGVTDTYRSYDAQVDVARRKGLYSQGGLAAKPGTSHHGLGLATDLDLDSRAQAWMRANAGRFGFVENTPREPWHWKFDGI